MSDGKSLADLAADALAKRVGQWTGEGKSGATPVTYTILDGLMTYQKGDASTPVTGGEERMVAKKWCPAHVAFLDAIEAVRKAIAAGAALDEAARQPLADLAHPVIAGAVKARGEELPPPRRPPGDPARLRQAAYDGKLPALMTEIERGADLEARGEHGWTALLAAAREAFRPGVEALLRAGANVNATLDAGFNGLHLVIEHTKDRPRDFRVTLTRNGQEVTLTDRAEIRAAIGSHPDDEYDDCVAIAKTLIEHGIDVEQETSDRQTPLSHAASRGSLEITELLIQTKKVALDSRDKDGVSPLHYASREGHADCVRALLRAGANPNITENYGFTPLHEAAENGHAEVARALLEAGADRTRGLEKPFERYPQGATPLDLARLRGRKDVIHLLE